MRLFQTRPSRKAHIVDAGKVGCPIEGRDVDIDRCVVCPRVLSVIRKDGVDVVTCELADSLVEGLFPAF